MAEYIEFICKNCGWRICAPAEGSDLNMDSIVAYFKCNDCNEVFGKDYNIGTVVNDPVICPKCGSTHTANWKPADGCQECGGELENKGLYCLED